jgi:hypothetical protein
MESHSNLPVNESIQPNFIPAPLDTSIGLPSVSMSKGEPEVSPSVARRKGPTKRASASTVIKRSASSPNVRAMASSEASSTMMSDKRRNKLGYHRTSVACGQFAPQESHSVPARDVCRICS